MPADCRVCFGPHNPEIHRATLAVRAWFKDQVNPAPFQIVSRPPKPKRKPREFELPRRREVRYAEV